MEQSNSSRLGELIIIKFVILLLEQSSFSKSEKSLIIKFPSSFFYNVQFPDVNSLFSGSLSNQVWTLTIFFCINKFLKK